MQPSGVGLGLRWAFIDEVVASEERLPVAFFEVSPENYMRRGGYIPEALERVRERYPLVTHGLTLSLGGEDEPDDDYLGELKTEIDRTRSPWHSDHLCFSRGAGRAFHDLLPLEHSPRTVERAADRVRRLEDRLKVPFAFENISWYAPLGASELPEHELINRLLHRSGAGLLLDVNNVYVNSLNHGFDPLRFIEELDLSRVVQLHVAGHTPTEDGVVIDTHGAPVVDPVRHLLRETLRRTGPLPVLLERDNAIPPLPVLLEEVRQLQAVYDEAVSGAPTRGEA